MFMQFPFVLTHISNLNLVQGCVRTFLDHLVEFARECMMWRRFLGLIEISLRGLPARFAGTGHSCCECVLHTVCTLLHAFQGALWHNKPGACHPRPPKSRHIQDVAALEHEFRFPIDLWRKSWTFGGWRQVDFLCGRRSTLVTPIDQQKQQPMS